MGRIVLNQRKPVEQFGGANAMPDNAGRGIALSERTNTRQPAQCPLSQ